MLEAFLLLGCFCYKKKLRCFNLHANIDFLLACLACQYSSILIFTAVGNKTFVMAVQAFKKFMPLFDRVLVQRFAPELKTKGGIVIPEKSSGKVLKATVVATGPGLSDKDGKVRPLNVAPGDKVLLPEYGGTTVTLDNQDYFLFRDTDILGKFEE